jgi:hypothetical protein
VNWTAIALIALGGFLIGGVISLWRQDAKPPAVICGVFAAAAIVGGVLWLL